MIDLKRYMQQEQPKGFIDRVVDTYLNTQPKRVLALTSFLGVLAAARIFYGVATSDLQPGQRNDLSRIAQEAEAANHVKVNGREGTLVSPLSTRLPSSGYIGPDGKLHAMSDRVSR